MNSSFESFLAESILLQWTEPMHIASIPRHGTSHNFPGISKKIGEIVTDEYRVELRDCCSPWNLANLGNTCKLETCAKIYCCHKDCRLLFHTSHIAIQRAPERRCEKYIASVAGMNLQFPESLKFMNALQVQILLQIARKMTSSLPHSTSIDWKRYYAKPK